MSAAFNRHVFPDGTMRWFDEHGDLHREDGPAVEHLDGSREWYRHGVLHREDGPAVESRDGTMRWYQHGRQHRVAYEERQVMQQRSKVERPEVRVVDYSAARAKAIEWLGDRYLLAKPINRITSVPVSQIETELEEEQAEEVGLSLGNGR